MICFRFPPLSVCNGLVFPAQGRDVTLICLPDPHLGERPLSCYTLAVFSLVKWSLAGSQGHYIVFVYPTGWTLIIDISSIHIVYQTVPKKPDPSTSELLH